MECEILWLWLSRRWVPTIRAVPLPVPECDAKPLRGPEKPIHTLTQTFLWRHRGIKCDRRMHLTRGNSGQVWSRCFDKYWPMEPPPRARATLSSLNRSLGRNLHLDITVRVSRVSVLTTWKHAWGWGGLWPEFCVAGRQQMQVTVGTISLPLLASFFHRVPSR